MSIKSVLEEYFTNIAVYQKTYQEDWQKRMEEAHSAILAEFEKMLPEKQGRLHFATDYRNMGTESWIRGYNQCLSDIKSKLREGER